MFIPTYQLERKNISIASMLVDTTKKHLTIPITIISFESVLLYAGTTLTFP